MTLLDIECAKKASELISHFKEADKDQKNKLRNILNSSIGVLQENGVYAFFLWLSSRKAKKAESEIAQKIEDSCKSLLSEQKLIPGGADPLNASLFEELEKLILTKKLIEQTLIYALYHAKAIEE